MSALCESFPSHLSHLWTSNKMTVPLSTKNLASTYTNANSFKDQPAVAVECQQGLRSLEFGSHEVVGRSMDDHSR